MNPIVESLMGMKLLSDEVIASDLLLTLEHRTYSLEAAIAAVASADLKSWLELQIKDIKSFQETIKHYQEQKGWIQPRLTKELLDRDLKQAAKALKQIT
ncbi:spore coat protein [Paenibacillus sediminis]|uniref:Spore coat protein n=1 Tax=Paenibacillus sediminis TaxID=664909 RepID=A0ABS4H2G7_9BACL|nr:spore coat protein [Paenibacillus sediminis]MBP1936310.1 hypothetical protein [Paenibacillus sediminis]